MGGPGDDSSCESLEDAAFSNLGKLLSEAHVAFTWADEVGNCHRHHAEVLVRRNMASIRATLKEIHDDVKDAVAIPKKYECAETVEAVVLALQRACTAPIPTLSVECGLLADIYTKFMSILLAGDVKTVKNQVAFKIPDVCYKSLANAKRFDISVFHGCLGALMEVSAQTAAFNAEGFDMAVYLGSPGTDAQDTITKFNSLAMKLQNARNKFKDEKWFQQVKDVFDSTTQTALEFKAKIDESLRDQALSKWFVVEAEIKVKVLVGPEGTEWDEGRAPVGS